MKILFISYTFWPPDFGGELLITIERFRSLVNKGYDVEVLTSGRPGFASVNIDDYGISVKRSPLVGHNQFGRFLRRIVFPIWCAYQIINNTFDILHYISIGAVDRFVSAASVWMITSVASLKGKPSITVHSLAEKEDQAFVYQGLERVLKNVTYARTRAIVSVSPALEQAVKACFPEKSRLVPNGVHNDLFVPLDHEERASFRKQKKVMDGEVVFSFLGTIGKRKGADLLASAFVELADDHPQWKLWIIGPKDLGQNRNLSQPEVNEIYDRLKRHANRVTYWGRIDDRSLLSKILASSDVFVFPSRKEGMPIAPLEAMSCEVPLIISRIPGVTDLANIDGETGLYITPGSLEELKSVMVKLGSDPELREKMGRAARKRIERDFSWSHHIDRWEQIYRALG